MDMKQSIRHLKSYLIIAVVILALMAVIEQLAVHIKDRNLSQFTIEEQAYIDNNVVYWVVENSYLPLVGFENGIPKGISADYINLISKKSGLNIKVRTACDFTECVELVQTGKADIITSIKSTHDRSVVMLFSRPYVFSGTLLVSATNSPKTVGIGKGYAVADYIKSIHPELNIVEFDNDRAAYAGLVDGSVDSVIMDSLSYTYIMTYNRATEYSVEELQYEYLYSFAVNNTDAVLLSIINKAIGKITEKEKQEIIERWT